MDFSSKKLIFHDGRKGREWQCNMLLWLLKNLRLFSYQPAVSLQVSVFPHPLNFFSLFHCPEKHWVCAYHFPYVYVTPPHFHIFLCIFSGLKRKSTFPPFSNIRTTILWFTQRIGTTVDKRQVLAWVLKNCTHALGDVSLHGSIHTSLINSSWFQHAFHQSFTKGWRSHRKGISVSFIKIGVLAAEKPLLRSCLRIPLSRSPRIHIFGDLQPS